MNSVSSTDVGDLISHIKRFVEDNV